MRGKRVKRREVRRLSFFTPKINCFFFLAVTPQPPTTPTTTTSTTPPPQQYPHRSHHHCQHVGSQDSVVGLFTPLDTYVSSRPSRTLSMLPTPDSTEHVEMNDATVGGKTRKEKRTGMRRNDSNNRKITTVSNLNTDGQGIA